MKSALSRLTATAFRAVYALTVAKNDCSGTLGSCSEDLKGDYREPGCGTTISDIDFGIASIFTNNNLMGNDDESLFVTIGKSFSFYSAYRLEQIL